MMENDASPPDIYPGSGRIWVSLVPRHDSSGQWLQRTLVGMWTARFVRWN